MDEHILNSPLSQAVPTEGLNALGSVWSCNLPVRPKVDSQASSDSDGPFSDESYTSPLSYQSSIEDPLSCSSPCEDEEYHQVLWQTDGPYDIGRGFPATRNPCITSSVPAYDDLVSQRRLRRLQLDTGYIDFAYLPASVPKGIVSGVFNRSPKLFYLMRRSSDGFFSAMSMYKVAFPYATAEEAEAERKYIESIPTTKVGKSAGNFWIHPDFALRLAEEYCLSPYIRALLDPTEIPTSTVSPGSNSDQITAPPKYPPTPVTSRPATPANAGDTAVQYPGDGSPIAPNGEPVSRLFDHRMSRRHQNVPGHLLTTYDPASRVLRLQGVDPVTNMLGPDLTTLVITIEGVIYEREDGEKQAGAIVFFDSASPWNSVAYVPSGVSQTKEQALLEGLSQAVVMIQHLAAADPILQQVRIMTSSTELCSLFGLGMGRMGADEAGAVAKWLRQTDMTYWKEINQRWKDLADGKAGRPVDMRLWRVAEECVQPAMETAISEMYRCHGRDWYAENGKGRDWFRTDGSSATAGSSHSQVHRRADITAIAQGAARQYLDNTTFAPPKPIADQGHDAVAKWTIETRALCKQAILYLCVSAEGCRDITNATREKVGQKVRTQDHWEAHARAMALVRAHRAATAYFNRFLAEHPARLHAGCAEGGQDGDVMDVDVGDEELVQTVVGMVMADEEVYQADGQMEWE